MSGVLIANRGDVAVRLARAARGLGLRSVVATTEAERDALHVRTADASVVIPGAGPSAYLDHAAVVDAAVGAQCELLHPGWGFLSESPELARACHRAAVTFVGPEARTLALFADKAAARDFAATVGVPVLPATRGGVTPEEAQAFLARQGVPVIVKALAGGGGRGLRVAATPSELRSALERSGAEADHAFGRGDLFVERYAPRARHIEVQLVGDGSEVVHVGTRDCSLQRRHQKVVELAPADGLGTAREAALLDAALRIGRAAGLQGLATVEFLVEVDDPDQFWFLEVNPRLQVEHGVTELVAGIDLVQIQLRIASGDRLAQLGLSSTDGAVLLTGRAGEARVTSVSGKPSRISAIETPGCDRVDLGVEVGDRPNPVFDPLLLKLMVRTDSADGRAVLVERLGRVVRQARVEGVATDLDATAHLLDVVRGGAEITASLGDEIQAPQVSGSDSLLRAPRSGVVVETSVAVGDMVPAGGVVVVIEAMKMQQEVRLALGGRIVEMRVEAGQSVASGEVVAIVEPADPAQLGESGGPSDPAHTPEADRTGSTELEDLRRRRAALEDGGRPDAIARRHSRGKRSARENVAAMVDDELDGRGFVEYGALMVAAQRSRHPVEELERLTPADGLVAGFGTVVGRETAVLAYDATVLAGTQGLQSHKKTERMFTLARRRGAPVVIFAEGGGGRPGDVDNGAKASGMDLGTFVALGRLNGRVPTVGIASGRTFAGNAALVGACDVVIATADARIGMGGPAMIEGGGLGRVEADEIGPAHMHARVGSVDILVADEVEAAATARRYLSFFTGPGPAGAASDQDELRTLVPARRNRLFDVGRLISVIADVGSTLELRGQFAINVRTVLARIDGMPLGVVANDARAEGGALDSSGSDKVARFLQLCDAFRLPVLTLVDTPGFLVGPSSEETGAVRHTGRLFVVGSNLHVPLCTIVVRRAWGLGGQAMAGGGFRVPDAIAAWPTASFGAMGPEGAVRLGFRRELDAITDEGERAAEFRRRVRDYERDGGAVNVASMFEIDDVIDPSETRRFVVSALRRDPYPDDGSRRVDTW